jgi:predicted glutamine amidotransferase
MCELLGMSANVPTDICFSFSGLIRRAGLTGPHTDGWGITFYEGKGSRTFRDPQPGAHSKIAELVRNYPIKSKVVISHVRRANRGKIALENTHPFSRELWGQNWTFAHNGELKGIKKRKLNFFEPVGTTDSEHAFCWMLDQLYHEYPRQPRSENKVVTAIEKAFKDLSRLGVFNVLLSNGQWLFANCSTNLVWVTRKAPFGKAQLIDADMQVDFSKETSDRDIVSIIATRPLTSDESWNVMYKGEIKIFKDGKIFNYKKKG